MTEPPPEHPIFATTSTTQVLILPSSPPRDPPPPYPSRERRRAGRSGRRRRNQTTAEYLQTSSADNESDGVPSAFSPFPGSPDLEQHPSETTPLLSPSRLPPGGIGRRPRTLSMSSTLHSAVSAAPSFTHTFISAFQPDRDCDLDPDDEASHDSDDRDLLESPLARTNPLVDQTRLSAPELPGDLSLERRGLSFGARVRRYFRPLSRRAYYSALLHLLVFNFPYALAAWIYLFVFTLVSAKFIFYCENEPI
jgi:hypothetical protein